MCFVFFVQNKPFCGLHIFQVVKAVVALTWRLTAIAVSQPIGRTEEYPTATLTLLQMDTMT